jgi:hypothetical protein
MTNSANEPQGCLALLFGIGGNSPTNRPASRGPVTQSDDDGSGMSEGDIHSGPGGYEGMGYSGGYAADYFDEGDER